jgi:hypothetical protein
MWESARFTSISRSVASGFSCSQTLSTPVRTPLAQTAKKLNVSFYEYVRGHVLKKYAIPPLSDLIQKAADEFMQRQSLPLACH